MTRRNTSINSKADGYRRDDRVPPASNRLDSHFFSLNQAERIARSEARKNRIDLLAEMARNEFSEHIAKIRSDGEIAFLVELFRFETGPAAVNLSTAYRTAEHHHHIAVTVVRAAVSVFLCGAAKLGHRYQNDIRHSISHILCECGQGIAELLQQLRQLAVPRWCDDPIRRYPRMPLQHPRPP